MRLPNDPKSPEFWEEYSRLLNQPKPRINQNTMSLLIAAWQQSPEWNALGVKTRREWTRHCKRIEAVWGPLEVRGLAPKNVLTLRDKYQSTPATANNMMRCLSSMLGWSVPREWRNDNPCREIKPLKGSVAYEPWTWDVIECARVELRPDLWWAVALALYTGQRLGDCLSMRWNAISASGVVAVKQEKTKKELFIPLHRDLRAVLDTIPRHAVTILTSAERTPWQTGFQATWSKHKPSLVRERGLVFHGLRKSAVVMLLEAGCTVPETASITGQTHRMVEHYAEKVSQAKLAASAILKWEAAGSS